MKTGLRAWFMIAGLHAMYTMVHPILFSGCCKPNRKTHYCHQRQFNSHKRTSLSNSLLRQRENWMGTSVTHCAVPEHKMPKPVLSNLLYDN